MLRVISGSIEITAAAFMFKFNDLEKAFYINSLLALVGPIILIVTTGLALHGLTDKISLTRFIGVAAGPPIMSLAMKDFLKGSYIIAGVLGVILTFIVFKFINVDEIEESNEVT